jgi:hypothetical protein
MCPDTLIEVAKKPKALCFGSYIYTLTCVLILLCVLVCVAIEVANKPKAPCFRSYLLSRMLTYADR